MDLDSALEGKPAQGTATDLLRADHREISRLFASYEQAAGEPQARLVFLRTLCMQLELHDTVERDVFYPAVEGMEPSRVAAATRDHEEILRIVRSLRDRATCDSECDEAVGQLKALVADHVNEEEASLFPVAEKESAALRELGRPLMKRKEELTRSTEEFEGPAT